MAAAAANMIEMRSFIFLWERGESPCFGHTRRKDPARKTGDVTKAKREVHGACVHGAA